MYSEATAAATTSLASAGLSHRVRAGRRQAQFRSPRSVVYTKWVWEQLSAGWPSTSVRQPVAAAGYSLSQDRRPRRKLAPTRSTRRAPGDAMACATAPAPAEVLELSRRPGCGQIGRHASQLRHAAVTKCQPELPLPAPGRRPRSFRTPEPGPTPLPLCDAEF